MKALAVAALTLTLLLPAAAAEADLKILRAGTRSVADAPAQNFTGAVQEIRTGDVVHIPPNVKHWHGAAPGSTMTHLAITEALDGKTVTWLEKVTDEQ